MKKKELIVGSDDDPQKFLGKKYKKEDYIKSTIFVKFGLIVDLLIVLFWKKEKI